MSACTPTLTNSNPTLTAPPTPPPTSHLLVYFCNQPSNQGRAIIIHIDGPVLGSEEIAQAISDLPVHSSSYVNRDKDLEDRGYVPQAGKKLVSAFAVTDCLQIVSGRVSGVGGWGWGLGLEFE